MSKERLSEVENGKISSFLYLLCYIYYIVFFIILLYFIIIYYIIIFYYNYYIYILYLLKMYVDVGNWLQGPRLIKTQSFT